METEKNRVLDDVKNKHDFESAAYSIINAIRSLPVKTGDKIYCIYSGGRRVMASYLMSALSLVGTEDHFLFYVGQWPSYKDTDPSFYYTPIKPRMLDFPGQQISTDDIVFTLEEILFPRLGNKYRDLVKFDKSYREMVEHIQSYLDHEKKPVIRVQDSFEDEPVIIGHSQKLKDALEKVKKFALAGLSPLMLYGETGTGKELFADYYHYWFSKQQDQKTKFVVINCSAVPRELIESELFGSKKGGFTGAVDRVGHLTGADGGVAFLDEINSAPMSMQAKLLRFIETGEVQIIGGIPDELKKNSSGSQVKVNVKLVAAMNEHAEALVNRGELRKDFYYRLVKGKISIPPLRDRKEDIPELVNYFLDQSCKKYAMKSIRISDSLMKKFLETEWLGNIRQLRDYIERLVVLATVDTNGMVSEFTESVEEGEIHLSSSISPAQILETVSGPDYQTMKFDDIVAGFERWLIVQSYQRNDQNAAQTAKDLGMASSTLKDKLKKFGIS